MKRHPQLALRLDAAAPDENALWRAGGAIAYLGEHLNLVLDTTARQPTRTGTDLHLPLPPAAASRQIRDAAESWLRDEALALFGRIVEQKSVPAGRRPLRIALAFGKRGDWARQEGEVIRCHWRLIEQPMAVIEQVLEQALTAARQTQGCDDLFAFA